MNNITLLRTLFRYHAWANDELLQKLVQIDPAQHKQERHAALRLITHAYVVDRIFAAHLTGAKHDFPTDSPEPMPLEELSMALAASDNWYLAYLDTATEEQLAEPVPFVFTDGDRGNMTREEMLTHVVIHDGYHRGEVGGILAQLAVRPPWDTFAVFLHQAEPLRRHMHGAAEKQR